MKSIIVKGQNHLTQVPASLPEARIFILTMVESFALGCSARLGAGEARGNTKGREVSSSTPLAFTYLNRCVEAQP